MTRRDVVDYAALTERHCNKCDQIKPIAEFGRYSDPKQPINGWRYYSHCIDCARAASREYGTANRERRNLRLQEWRRSNPQAAAEKDRRAAKLRDYRMTAADVDAMFAAQEGRCLICDKTKRLNVDHDHATGHVRGGLCTGCNNLLGRLETKGLSIRREPHDLAEAALIYLGWPPELLAAASTPKRIQYSRKKGAKNAGPGVRYCGRPGPFGNPFIIGETLPDGTVIDRDLAVSLHKAWLATQPALIARIRRELAGYDALGCRCGLDEPCHVDTILRVLAGGTP